MADESTARTISLTRIRHDEAFLRTIMNYGVPVRTMARILGCSRQTIYRRMREARQRLRRAAAKAADGND